jgi:lipoate-protein ligase A
MQYLDLTLPTGVENLALDEALLDEAESEGELFETLRLWEPAEPMVVVGRSSRIQEEVRLDVCRKRRIPVLRRASGGAAVVTGPGCLMYALVLSFQRRPHLRMIDQAHTFVLGRLISALRPHVPEVGCRGTSDLAMRDPAGGDLKFSGNSIRAKRDHLLYHGTLLYDFPLQLIEDCLGTPPRQPDYRGGRPHAAFVANLPLSSSVIRRAVRQAFDAAEPRLDWPRERTDQLVAARYGCPEWHEHR